MITGVPAAGYTPAPIKHALTQNYIDFATLGASDGWAQQYLPDLMEKEAEVFGNRTIAGFLSQVGAEESMTSDQVVWSEQGRLHLSYTATRANDVITIANDVDGNPIGVNHGIRPGDMLLISDANATVRAYCINVDPTAAAYAQITVKPYATMAGGAAANMNATAIGNNDLTVLVFGSEYVKGATGRGLSNEPQFKSRKNKPIIIKDQYHVSGSDASAIGWVEVSGEDGQSGYLWYLKAAGDTRQRFTDYLEMTMLEAQDAAQVITANPSVSGVAQAGAAGTITGSEGLFSALTTRGNQTSGITGVPLADLAEFDLMLAELDKNGAIEENMLFVDRTTALAIDDMLAAMNSYGAGGTSYGVFNNSEDMALNLGFSGFRRGSYDFYKSDFKYLNDKGTRGGLNDAVNNIRGVMIPAGVSSVYDEQLGKNLKRPFLHVRYRASQTDNRRFKTWTTGSVGATTSDLDAMEMHFLSERCLVVQGANNFFLLN
tara:strand:- start:827 stop:2290 length:1464 start_codon:yes stop_codon:yes gene_type:complete